MASKKGTAAKKSASATIKRKKELPSKEKSISEKNTRKLVQIKRRLENGDIKTWDDIFVIISWTTFGNLFGLQYKQFRKKLEDPLTFTFRDVKRLSEAVDVSFDLANKFIFEYTKNPVMPAIGK